MMFLAIKPEDGAIKGKISFYCRMLKVTRQGFYKYLAGKDRPWKYQQLADAMRTVVSEDEYNDTYGRIRMYQADSVQVLDENHLEQNHRVNAGTPVIRTIKVFHEIIYMGKIHSAVNFPQQMILRNKVNGR